MVQRKARNIFEKSPWEGFTPCPLFGFLDGKEWTLDGIHGHFQHETSEARYPYRRIVERLNHVPSAKGMQSKRYKAIRRKLGDDWTTDMTNSVESYCDVATALGFTMDMMD